MNFDFTDVFPVELNLLPILISGPDSLHENGREYLVVEVEGAKSLYEIRYQYHCSPFKQAILIDNILAVGHEEYFYLFDLSTNTNSLRLMMSGYFGHLYFDNELFYIADAVGLYCIDKDSSIRWRNDNLGIDGVIVGNFFENEISGSGEWDPPGGWEDFIINRHTGATIE